MACASGLSPGDPASSNGPESLERGGADLPTPLVYQGLLYLLRDNGVLAGGEGTMTEPARLAALLSQAYFGEPERPEGIAWHGPSVQHVVAGVTASLARLRLEGGHSIWEIALHIAVWDEICRRRLEGEAISLTTGDPGDWPDCPIPTEEAWEETRHRLRCAQVALVDAVARLGAEDLRRPTVGCPWTCHTMVHGTLHHDLYHAGQIAILRRLLEARAG